MLSPIWLLYFQKVYNVGLDNSLCFPTNIYRKDNVLKYIHIFLFSLVELKEMYYLIMNYYNFSHECNPVTDEEYCLCQL